MIHTHTNPYKVPISYQFVFVSKNKRRPNNARQERRKIPDSR